LRRWSVYDSRIKGGRSRTGGTTVDVDVPVRVVVTVEVAGRRVVVEVVVVWT
jgi:hypothetical protein